MTDYPNLMVKKKVSNAVIRSSWLPYMAASTVIVLATGAPCCAATITGSRATYDTALHQFELTLAFDPVIDTQTPYGIGALTIDVDGSFPFVGPDVTANGATIRKANFDGLPTDTVSIEFDPPIATSPTDLTLTFRDFDTVDFLAGSATDIDLEINRFDPSPEGQNSGSQIFNNLVVAVDIDRPPPEIRTWQFEATVVQLDDPEFEAADVRPGDTISGTFSYDVSTPPSGGSTPDYAEHAHPPNFQGIQLAIENPRSDTRLEYFPLISGGTEYWADIWTDESSGEWGIDHYQTPTTPDPDWFDWIYMGFIRTGTPDDLSLPEEHNLDDWEQAFILLWADFLSDGLTAQIHTIKPVALGDFNLDGNVDEHDYAAWRSAYGASEFSLADGNRDSRVEAADYTLWRDGFGTTTVGITVPEPTASVIALVLTLGLMLIRCRRHCIDCKFHKQSDCNRHSILPEHWMKYLHRLSATLAVPICVSDISRVVIRRWWVFPTTVSAAMVAASCSVCGAAVISNCRQSRQYEEGP